MTDPAVYRPRHGFTLVELLTVMGILGILVALVVGAAHGIREHAARTETEQTLKAIEAGLSRYYTDWRKFPWYDDDQHPLTGMVRGESPRRAEAGYRPLDSGDMNRGDPAAACLYASLAMDERSGPYYAGSGGNTRDMDYEGVTKYTVFVDGWDRPIHYFQPRPNPNAPSGPGTDDPEYYHSTPLLMSEGPVKDMEGEADTQKDNLYNYPVDEAPAFSEYYQ